LINNLNGNIGEVACWKDVRTISFPGWIALLKKEYHPRKPSAEEDDYWKKKLHWSLWLQELIVKHCLLILNCPDLQNSNFFLLWWASMIGPWKIIVIHLWK
jgi:hypothetical protein